MDVIGIGLANIDLVAHVSDSFLSQHKIGKGSATKIDVLDFARIRGSLNFNAIPGGCAANTICGLAASGVSTRFFGKIGEDEFESLYRSSFRDYTVAYDVPPSTQESSQCAVLITPDGERSFAYTHAASWDLQEADLDPQQLSNARLIYAEVYLFEFGPDRKTARAVFEAAATHNIPMAMKVMDRDFGKRYAQHIKALSDAGTLTLLIGNHEHLPSVAGTADLQEAISTFKTWKCDVLLTANKNGCYFISKGEVTHYPIEPVTNPKNTAGAGDQFTAGFLTGWLKDQPVSECVKLGANAARVILGHDTARPPLVSSHSISF